MNDISDFERRITAALDRAQQALEELSAGEGEDTTALAAERFGPLLFGALVGGIFAAILSTADSQLLVVASTFVRDIWEKVLRGDAEVPETERLRMARVVVIVAGIVATLLALLAQDLVF